jgi:hypothetical protein
MVVALVHKEKLYNYDLIHPCQIPLPIAKWQSFVVSNTKLASSIASLKSASAKLVISTKNIWIDEKTMKKLLVDFKIFCEFNISPRLNPKHGPIVVKMLEANSTL